MMKLADLPLEILQRLDGLWGRIRYQVDKEDKDHEKKILHTPGNYNCVDQTPAAFAAAVLRNAARYWESRKGKVGKRTSIIFHEFIYSSSEAAFLSKTERAAIGAEIVSLFPDVPIRLAWHEDPVTGRSDLHVLFGYHTEENPPRVLLSARYGAGKRSFSFTAFITEKRINESLNQARGPIENRLVTTAEVGRERRPKRNREKQTPADILITILGPDWDGERKNLIPILRKKKIAVTRHNDEFLSVVLPGRKRAVRLYLDELVQAYDRAKQRQIAAAKTAARKKRQLGSQAADDL
ncbi:MAG: hypothetical protein QOH01_3133 [Verrucomicrobiota bacterium]|jgi:hypothetical protein